MNILAEETIDLKKRIRLLSAAPLIYFLFFVLSYVEYIALIKALFNLKRLKSSVASNNNTWEPVRRLGYLAKIPS
jgi:hypothetical protein